MTQRVIRALENPFVTMLAHPTGRLLLKRDPYQIDIPAVLDAAARTGTWIELNAAPKRLDLDWRWWPLAKQKGVKCVINPDAHRTERLQDLWFGIGIARKGWLTKDDVMNCLPLGKIEKALRAKSRKVERDSPSASKLHGQSGLSLRSSLLSLRHEHGETFAGAAGFDEFAHRQLVAAVAALLQLRRRAGARLRAKRCRGRSRRRYMKSASLLPARHRSNQSRARGLRVARIHRRHLETKTPPPSGSGQKQVSR